MQNLNYKVDWHCIALKETQYISVKRSYQCVMANKRFTVKDKLKWKLRLLLTVTQMEYGPLMIDVKSFLPPTMPFKVK